MPEDADRRPAQALRRFRPLVLWLLAWTLAPLFSWSGTWGFRIAVDDVIFRVLSGFPGWAFFVWRAVHWFETGLAFTFTTSLFAVSLLLPMGFAARLVAGPACSPRRGPPQRTCWP